MNAQANRIYAKLAGGDRRSIGRSNEVVAEVLADPALFPVLIDGMTHTDPLVSMRCADAAEKVSAVHPEYLRPHKAYLLTTLAAVRQQEIRWHVAQMLPRLPLDALEHVLAVAILRSYLRDRSRIVATCAMQALADLAQRDDHLREEIVPLLERLTLSGSPAMKARGRRLLGPLHKPSTHLRTT